MSIPFVIKRIQTGTAEYEQMLELRDRVLRIPLGLSVRNDNLSQDAQDVLLVAYRDFETIGCVILHPIDKEVVRLRAMAVTPEYQGTGIGRLLVEEAERVAQAEGFLRIILHARVVVSGFYEKLGYLRYGEVFTEVGIPHILMQKIPD
jgi:GNAT superfamily N-acetyltransferase